MFLPDVNFWLALAFRSHKCHASARNWMQSAAPRSVVFCRVTQLGLLRLATNLKAFPMEAVPMNQAWRIYDELLSDDRIGFAEEPDLIAEQLRKFSQLQAFSTNVWTDAYLAAFAVAADFEMVTFDKGFAQFKNLRRTILP